VPDLLAGALDEAVWVRQQRAVGELEVDPAGVGISANSRSRIFIDLPKASRPLPGS
jgi:hypothetical protein